MKLLVHITYYSNETRVDKIKKRPSDLFDKDSQQWRDHVYEGVLKVISAINNYDKSMFHEIMVVINMNMENTYDKKLLEDVAKMGLVGVVVKIDKSIPPHHPFYLTTVHRKQIEDCVEDYDWFLYTEDDNLVPFETIKQMVTSMEPIYEKSGYLIGPTRMVFDENKNVFYSDIQRSSRREDVIKLFDGDDGMGSCYIIKPTNTYSGCWMYPKNIMKEFIGSLEWKIPNQKHMIREKMAWGFKKDKRMILLGSLNGFPIKPKNSFVYHLGFSGDYYLKPTGGAGWHTLKENLLVI